MSQDRQQGTEPGSHGVEGAMDTSGSPSASSPGQAWINRLVAALAIIAVAVAAGFIYVKTKQATEAGNRNLERATQYDMVELQKVDSALIKWKQVARLETGLPSARCIAVNSAGEVLIGGDDVVRKLGQGGGREADFAVAGAAQALACDAEGKVYVAFRDRVAVLGPTGRQLAAFAGLGEKALITSIAVGGGNVFIADFGNRVVHRCDMTGKVLNVIGKEDRKRNLAGLNLPSAHMDVAVVDGTVWLANTGLLRLENYSAEGLLNRYWGESGSVSAIEKFAGCCNPADFCVLADGSFITAEKGVVRVKRYLPDGRFDSVVTSAENFPKSTIGLDLAGYGDRRVYVLARGSGMVFVFEPKGGSHE